MLDNEPKNQTANPEHDDLLVLQAALFTAIGTKAQLSRSGFSVVFKPEYRLNRADLSGYVDEAMRQLDYAGINSDAVTPQQVEAYLSWRTALDNNKAAQDARILITRKFTEPYHGATGSCGTFNTLKFIDGLGNEIAWSRIECSEHYDPNAINQIGRLGAFCHTPNYAEIEREIVRLKAEFPLFAQAPLIDNNKKGA